MNFQLKVKTSPVWLHTVLENFDQFLVDHAACEKKASSMAMSMVCHYPDKKQLVMAMTDLAVEELNHFREVIKLMMKRGLKLSADEKDPYVNQLRIVIRGKSAYLLDRLLVASIIEARGAERFSLIAEGLEASDLKNFYEAISKSEFRHYELFLELAEIYYPANEIQLRLDELLDMEAKIIGGLPFRAALH